MIVPVLIKEVMKLLLEKAPTLKAPIDPAEIRPELLRVPMLPPTKFITARVVPEIVPVLLKDPINPVLKTAEEPLILPILESTPIVPPLSTKRPFSSAEIVPVASLVMAEMLTVPTLIAWPGKVAVLLIRPLLRRVPRTEPRVPLIVTASVVEVLIVPLDVTVILLPGAAVALKS